MHDDGQLFFILGFVQRCRDYFLGGAHPIILLVRKCLPHHRDPGLRMFFPESGVMITMHGVGTSITRNKRAR